MRRLVGILLALRFGPLACACSYSTFVWEPSSEADPPYYSIWTGDKQGWMDRSGKRIPFEPQPAAKDPDRLVPFQVGDLLGYKRRGDTVIPPRFLTADEFSEGRARVVLEGPCVPAGGMLCGGKPVLPLSAVPRWVRPLDVQAGFWRSTAPACFYTFVNEAGEVLGRPGFRDAAAFQEGMAAVQVDGLWGYIDKDLSIVIPPRFRAASGFSEGLAAVLDSAGYFYIDQAGTVRIPGPFDSAGDFHEGLAAVYQGGRSYYIDKTGMRAVPGVYSHAGRFFHGLANVLMRDGRLAYIDRTGRAVYQWSVR